MLLVFVGGGWSDFSCFFVFLVGPTSIAGVLFAFALLAAGGIRARTPVRVHLHVQLALAARQLIVFGLLFASEGVPLCHTFAIGFVVVVVGVFFGWHFLIFFGLRLCWAARLVPP